MRAHTTYQLRAYAKQNGYVRLEGVLEQCAVLYNAALQERRDAHKMGKNKIGLYDQQNQFTHVRADMPEWGDISTHIGRGVLRRVDRAFQGFFDRVKKGQTPGYPRFKSRRRYRCIEMAKAVPGMVKSSPDGRHAYIRIKGLPVLKLRTKRALPSSNNLKGIRIIKRPIGWYVDLSYEVEKEPLELSNECVGIDLGVNKRLTLSNGEAVPRREINREYEENLHRKISRKKKGSNRRRKAVKTLARHSYREHIRNRNKCHRMTTDIVRRFGFIGIEDLIIKLMVLSASGTIDEPGTNVAAKSGLNRSILEQTWGVIISQLVYKAAWAGRELVKVDPRYTSQTCSKCGKRRVGPWPDYNVFECSYCGLVMDRDLNAAINILDKALEIFGQGPRPSSEMARKIAPLDDV